MRAKDIMTANVITVRPETTILEAAKVLLAKRISAAPVVDAEGHLCGIISEGDLVRRHEMGTEKPKSWWTDMFRSAETAAGNYVKAHGPHTKDVMTRKVTTVDEETQVEKIVEILENRHILRVPVMRADRLVGIVSRANLLQGLVASLEETRATSTEIVDDTGIQREIMTELTKNLAVTAADVSVVVRNGVVHIWGMMDSEEERAAVEVMAENIRGVSAVENHAGLGQPRISGL